MASKNRDANDCAALSRAGVDTATVEYQALHHELHEDVLSRHWRPLFTPVLRESPETIAPGNLLYVTDFESPTETDTYEEKLHKAVAWARNRMGTELIVGGGIWALSILAHLGEARLLLGRTPSPSSDPTPQMLLAGIEAMEDQTLFARGDAPGLARRVQHVWRAMEKAR